MEIKKFKDNLALKNDGKLSVFFLGTGSAFSKKYFQTNLLIVKGKDHVLIDCGSLCPVSIEDFGLHITDIRNFYVTHSHADHIGGLEEVALKNYFISHKRPSMIITDEYKKILWEQSLQGGCAYGETKDEHSLTFDDYFLQIKPKKIAGGKFPLWEANIGSINLKFFRTVHLAGKNTRGKVFHSTGVVIDDKVLFSGDTKFNPEQLDFLCSKFNFECIFHDCQIRKGGVHASYDELKTLPADIKKKTYICHYDDLLAQEKPKSEGFAGFVKRGYYYIFN